MATPNLTAITTVTPKILASAQMASGDNAAYTVPANKAAQIKTMVLSNVSGAAVTITVSVIPSGGSVDGTHKVVSGYSLASNDSTTISEVVGSWLGAGDKVNVNAAAATAIDCVITGLEFA
ncbi:L-lysine 2,3-aminomutase [Nocardioides ginsengisegetis]|uniref:L-lysine 2,3-aminomutase n=1 Tax=Nocardioides ginsengisegetis TaxID=661491 RepID=A0A7W3PBZ9_9ACTN|nr:hypothetical protein [Nocardioides ginsengisegetis]MBA8805992.1 L-lysine 2,3-aminomutase [Nocardioides ginsengisegetis]